MLQAVDGKIVLGPVAEDCKPVVVGVDFGTAYSGVAFAYKDSPGSLFAGAPSAEDPQMKEPTALLLQENGSWEFGNTALQIYNEAIINYRGDGGTGLPPYPQLFKHFKMQLKDKTGGFTSLHAFSTSGVKKSLMELVTESLRILKNYAMQKVKTGHGAALKINSATDVQWVLTVPAIWTDFGKAFMRRAAFRAGMIPTEQSDNLLLVLEPEGASLAVQAGGMELNLLSPGSKFMVVDCGGGTVDITAHEVMAVDPYLEMRSIAIPDGGHWGGDQVNVNFKAFLRELLGAEFKEDEYPYEYHVLYEAFDDLKIRFDPTKDPSTPLALKDILPQPRALSAMVTAYNAAHPTTPIIQKPAINMGHLPMSKELMLSFFEPLLQNTVACSKSVLATDPSITFVVVVGGFGASKVVRARMAAELGRKYTVILPDINPRPQGAIAHGAVYAGMHRMIMGGRLARYTYGVHYHPDEFRILVRKGDPLTLDHEVTLTGRPTTKEQTDVTWKILQSDPKPDPAKAGKFLDPAKASTEPRLGALTVPCPRTEDGTGRSMTGTFKFGGSEIRISIENAVGTVTTGKIDYSN